ncbi:conserved hypothetical protein [Paenibacillus curdlanolyticus YK9]|uniref:DUF2800 domain-containing protein n=1 Tax=Paenibacillus curdlanolyticus YK9 TaxID=717606 RepID=E0IBR1_9BACL|nr:DUF2800 domain-containing protein [Paenibacillus curdlanolyticus]EFM10141.1 conserved hypothetical protein [Paenibacillus curdlanolyticus YK9]
MSQIVHAERAHALLSASGAHRWLHCTPSARLEATLPDTTSEAASRGTLAHELAELKLRRALGLEQMTGQKYAAAVRKFKANELYEPDMDANTDAYVDFIQGIVHSFQTPPYIAVERRVDISAYVPEAFGTSDCIIIGGKQLYIIDYKNGQGVPVPAQENPQMMLYALGALQAYSLLYAIETVHVAIVQPKVWDEPSEWSLTAAELLAWGESIKPIAARAFAGEGEYAPGEHCGFCRARSTCRARVEGLLSIEDKASLKPPMIGWDEVADILRRGDGLVKWYSSLKEAALAEVLKGGDVPGWKAVEGRGSRQFADIDAAFIHMERYGIDGALLYERKPITAAAAEKLFDSKKMYKQVLEDTGHVVKQSGAPTLAPAEDLRPSINNQVTAEQAFGGQ